MGGVLLPASALPTLHDFISRYYLYRPVDHLLFEWGHGAWDAEDVSQEEDEVALRGNATAGDQYLRDTSPAVFRSYENLFEHLGSVSSMGHDVGKVGAQLQCGTRLPDTSCFERFEGHCKGDEIMQAGGGGGGGLSLSPC
jgi:hypothetical protein